MLSGLTAPGWDKITSMARLSSPLLILLLGKYCANSNVRSGSQMMSSQIFFPRSSRSGREQKSSSHSVALGIVLPLVVVEERGSVSAMEDD